MHSVFDRGACLRLYQIKQIHNQLLPVDISEMEKKVLKDIYSYIVLQNTHLTLIHLSLETLQFNTVITQIKLQ